MSGMIRDLRKFNRLSRIANATLGSSGPGEFKPASTQHVRFEIVTENLIKAHYQGAITVSSQSMLNTLMTKYIDDALRFIKASAENFVELHNEEFANKENGSVSKLSLKLNELSITDSVEFTSYSIYKPVQSAMLRVTVLIDVSGGDASEETKDKDGNSTDPVLSNIDKEMNSTKKVDDLKSFIKKVLADKNKAANDD